MPTNYPVRPDTQYTIHKFIHSHSAPTVPVTLLIQTQISYNFKQNKTQQHLGQSFHHYSKTDLDFIEIKVIITGLSSFAFQFRVRFKYNLFPHPRVVL